MFVLNVLFYYLAALHQCSMAANIVLLLYIRLNQGFLNRGGTPNLYVKLLDIVKIIIILLYYYIVRCMVGCSMGANDL